MVLLRPELKPSLLPSQAVAPQQRRMLTMNQPGLYQQQQLAPSRPGSQQVQVEPYRGAETEQGETEDYTTEDVVNEQVSRIQSMGPPPSLQPGARVRSPDANLVQPIQFQQFYEQFDIIGRIGQNKLAAEQSRAQFRQMQRMQEIMSQQVPGYQSPQYQQGGVGSQAYGRGVPSNPRANFRYAQGVAPKFGWGNSRELSAWYELGMKESGWNNNAQNPTSTAYGIGQFLNSTWGNYGFRKSSDPAYQVNAMAHYIRARYGSPSRALAFHRRNNWY